MNKATYSYLLLLYLFLSGCVQESIEEPKMGTVSFSKVTFEHFGNVSPNGRIAAESEWKHIFAESATLLITNKATGQEYTLEYDPNDFTEAYQIQLPFGEYTVFSEVEGDDFETFLPFTISGEFTLDETSLDISLQGSTEYGLVTVKKEFVQSANLDGAHELVVCEHDMILYLYVKAGLSPTLTIYENFNGQTLQKELAISPYNHYHHYLKLTESQGTVNFIELAIGPFEYHEEYFEIGYLGCGDQDGYVYDINGNQYPVVQIGEQTWMAEDLKTTYYNNGDPIALNTAQPNQYTPAMRMNADNSIMYNFYAGTDPRKLCPCGYHLPSDEEWKTMEQFLGITIADDINDDIDLSITRGSEENIGGKLKSTEGWASPNVGATNESGFSSIPYMRTAESLLNSAYYLTSTIHHDNRDECGCEEEVEILWRWLGHYSAGIAIEIDHPSAFGQVRCVKD